MQVLVKTGTGGRGSWGQQQGTLRGNSTIEDKGLTVISRIRLLAIPYNKYYKDPLEQPW